jgi:hypothetical protein
LEIDEVLAERTKKLIAVVYKKIVALDFPDITKYPQTYKGVLEFEEDLLKEAEKE